VILVIAECTTNDQRIGLIHHVIAVADAIAYAHGRNIIHRDLKPGNVIVGDFGETVVIDWGLAKDVRDKPELVNDAPYEGGWMVRIKLSNPAEADALMDQPAYTQSLT